MRVPNIRWGDHISDEETIYQMKTRFKKFITDFTHHIIYRYQCLLRLQSVRCLFMFVYTSKDSWHFVHLNYLVLSCVTWCWFLLFWWWQLFKKVSPQFTKNVMFGGETPCQLAGWMKNSLNYNVTDGIWTPGLGRLRGPAVACWTTDHYHPCSNLGVAISKSCFVFVFASLHLGVGRPI